MKEKRILILTRECTTKGRIRISADPSFSNHCGNENCNYCNKFVKQLTEQIKKYSDKLWDI